MPVREAKAEPSAETVEFALPDVDELYASMAKEPDRYAEAMKAIESGREKVVDAVLFCGRFDQRGRMLRECEPGDKPYRLVHVVGDSQYRRTMSVLRESWSGLPKRIREAQVASEWRRYKRENLKCGIRKAREAWYGSGFSGGGGMPMLYSDSDLGSNRTMDPNQYTEFTPWFSGPFYKNMPYAYFPGMAYSREAVNHHPIARRIIELFVQYALGRNFDITCSDSEKNDRFRVWMKQVKLKHKMRKFWIREYLTDGELTIDKVNMASIDASTIMDVVCEGWDEFIDKPLYLQQMFQTATQTYAGIDVPGVPGSKDSKPGAWIIRQIPADQVIRIKTNCTSQEKRGRPILFSILGWLKRLKDTYSAQVLGEQLASSFVFDDTVDGSPAQVAAHAAKYTYIPVAPSIFVHNKQIKREAIQQTGKGSSGTRSDISQEILALLATSQGFPKDFFNVMAQGSGSRATAIVGSEPATKAVEDLQQDAEDLLDQVVEYWCQLDGSEYSEDEWEISFPPVTKDSNKDTINNIATAKEMGAFSPRRAAIMTAAALEADDYDYDYEMKQISEDAKLYPPSDIMPGWQIPPPGRFGVAPLPANGDSASPGDVPGDTPDNPIHGDGKQDLIKSHKTL